jgi:two-component system, cell cycle sensor histidine kinase and response regulator CckA
MLIGQPKPGLVSSLQRLSSTAAAVVGAFGLVVLIGRSLRISFLEGLLPDPATLKSITALSFALAGVALWFVREEPASKPVRWVVRACPIVIAAISVPALAANFLAWNLGMHQVLLWGPATLNPLRMLPVTALNFLLIGLALALFRLPVARRYVYAQCCATFAGLQSLLFLMAYAYSLLLRSGAASVTAISLPKTLAFLLLTVGTLIARPDRGLMAVITDAGAGGRLVRRGLLITVAVPFGLCWLGMVGPRAGYYGTEFGLALSAASIIGVFATLIWGYARSLVITDSQRKRAEDFLNGQKQIFEMISKGLPLEDTLSALVHLMETQREGYFCSILLLDRDGVHLRHGAAPGLPADYVQAIDGKAIGPKAGSCGTAAFRREPVLVQDIATDPLWSDYKQFALPHGLRSCWSTPILDENQSVLGTFAIYHTKPLQLSRDFLGLVNVATYTAAICIKHHAAEESLRQSVLHLSMVYNSVADVIFHIRVEPDGQFRFDSVNPAFYQETGLKESQVIGKLVEEVIPEPSLSLIVDKYREAIRTRQTVIWEEETRYPTETKSGDVTVTPVFNSEGNCTSLIGSVHDVTQRKRLEQQFRQAQKMEVVGQLAGGVAHDFNNLLTVINGYSEIVLQRLSPDDPNHSFVDEIKKAGDRAASLTHQLLAFSRRQVLQSQVLCLNSVITNMEKMLRRLMGDGIDMVTTLDADLGSVKADPGQMEQIVLNLVVNARDAMSHGGKLTIETSNVVLGESYAANHITTKPGPHVMLAVSDTGIGMDAETQKHIFEPFFTTKEVGKGTGLGLSTVYGIVKQSEGNVWVYSEPGLGTTFKIYLPRVDRPVEVVETLKAEAKLPGGTETILLVEDEPSVRLLVRTTLESNGYQVLEATNGAEALLIGEQHQGRIHFLLTDLVMPGISGRMLAEQLAPRRPELKVLFLSGYTDDVVVRHGALNAGMAFLQKPFTPDALARKVREVMDAGR